MNSRVASTYGIALNQGATDQYLSAANYAGIAGANSAVQFSVEMLVSGLGTGYAPLMSYANGQTTNAFLIEITDTGTISLTYRSSDHDTGISAATLTDGGTHRLSVTWDGTSATGAYIVYIDGLEVGHGTHPRQNWQMDAGGALIFGQEQDSIGGGFQSSQIIVGSIGDIRIFNDIRTAAEIAANAFGSLTSPASTQDLVDNWQVSANSAGSLTDAHDGTVLTINGAATVHTIGNWDNDVLDGGAGNDILDGAAGIDTMIGGTGDDIFYVNSFVDSVVEATSEGFDTVRVTSNFFLYHTSNDAEIERMETGDVNGTTPLIFVGNQFAQEMIGNAGNNVLDGRGGIDSFIGHGGNDIYVVDNAAEQIIEIAGEGYDAVYTSVSYTLAQGLSVERYVTNLQAGTNIINLTGNELGQVIGGNAANNFLNGAAGNDSLYGYNGNDYLEGGAGNDNLFGGAGVDRFVFRESLGTASGIDRIYDMSVVDNIQIDAIDVSSFANLSADQFALGTAALDANDRVIYDNTTGVFWFDPDGIGAHAAILFGVINNFATVSISYDQFELV